MKEKLKKFQFVFICIIGIILGLCFKNFAINIKPIGTLLLNFIFVFIVPLVFFTVVSNIIEIKNQKVILKTLGISLIVFVATLFITGLFTLCVHDIANFSFDSIKIDNTPVEYENAKILDKLVGLLSVNDFALLFSKSNILPLIVFSIIIGISINTITNNEKIVTFFTESKKIVNSYLKLIMKIFPICIVIYLGALIGEFGTILIKEYILFFILYLIIGCLNILIFHTIYLYIAGGKQLVKTYYKNILKLIVTAVSTQSSVVTMPTNMQVLKKMDVSDNINDVITPIATLINMQGNVIQNLLKIFLVCNMYSINYNFGNIIIFIIVAMLAGMVTAGIPGGGIVSNTITLSVLGLPMEALPILITIEMILDAPATAFNILSDTSTIPLIDKLVGDKVVFRRKKTSK